MAKKTSNKTGIKSEFSTRPRSKKETEPTNEEPQEVSIIIPEEEESVVEEPEVEPVPVVDDEPQWDCDNETLFEKIQDNWLVYSNILLMILVIALSFVVYYERSMRLSDFEDDAEVQVDNEFDALTAVVKDYVQTISDSNKEQLCKQLYSVYIDAAESTQDVEATLKTIREKSREILGFDERVSRTNEAEWQKLFGSTGVIDNWLITANIEITEANKRDIFTAIAKGLN